MQINNIHNTNFGAIVDLKTRAILIKANKDGVDTRNLEALMKEVHAEKFVFAKDTYDGDTVVDLYSKDGRVATLYKHIIKFNSFNCDMKEVVEDMTAKFLKIKNERTNTQKIIDRIENNFGRYPNENEYSNLDSYVR